MTKEPVMHDSPRLRPALIALLSVVLSAHPSLADPKATNKCRGATIKAGAAFIQAEAKALQKCRETDLRGKKACDQLATTDKLVGARAKLRSTILKSCAGDDKSCDVPDAKQ